MLPRNKNPPPDCAPVRDLMDVRKNGLPRQTRPSAHERARTQTRLFPQKNCGFV
jgi:hypothetical protein